MCPVITHRLVLLCTCLCACATNSSSHGSASDANDTYCASTTAWPSTASSLEEQLLLLINQQRAAGADCGDGNTFGATGAVVLDPALQCAARLHAADMANNNFGSFVGSDGSTPDLRSQAAGYALHGTIGEDYISNLPATSTTAQSIMSELTNVSASCIHLFAHDSSQIGVGYAVNSNSQKSAVVTDFAIQ